METGEYAKAIKDFTLAINYYPHFAKAYINRSIARKKLDDIQGAQADRQKARRITQAHRDDRLQKVNFADTSENFKRLISLQSSHHLPRHFGNLKESVKPRDIYSLYLKNNNTQNLTRLIGQHLKKTQLSPELQYLGKSFVLTTHQTQTHPAEFYRKKIASLSDSIQQYPDSAQYLLKQALFKARTKNYNGALHDLAEAAKLWPNHFLIHFLRGNIRNKMIHYIQMMQDDSKILNISLDDKLVEQTISREVNYHDYNKAINDYNKSIKLAPRFVYSYYNRANTKIKNKNYQGALQDYDKAIFLDNDFARAYFNRGLTYIYLQQTTQGCIDISKAGELGLEEAYTVIKLYCQ
jgi:tetratricopeptide (TPR) repeat protein